jgi:hypothetical protein
MTRTLKPKKRSATPPTDKHEAIVKCAYGRMVDIGKLKPNPANPNTHPEVQIE